MQRKEITEMSQYGAEFDRKAERWAAIEDEHDRYHSNRSECEGLGACSLRCAANTLEQEMLEALRAWRVS